MILEHNALKMARSRKKLIKLNNNEKTIASLDHYFTLNKSEPNVDIRL